MNEAKKNEFSGKIVKQVENSLGYLTSLFEKTKLRRLVDPDSHGVPVLLLYGFGATRRTIHILERRLRRDHFRVFSLDLGGTLNTFNISCIEENAKNVEEKIESLCELYKFDKLNIVGHSKGGLIGTYYTKFLKGKKRVKTLITMATAHKGYYWALLACVTPPFFLSKSVRQMIPNSSFLKKLAREPLQKGTRFISIFSKKDIICYHKNARLYIPEGTTHVKNIELPDMTHPDFVIRKEVYEVVREELRPTEKTES